MHRGWVLLETWHPTSYIWDSSTGPTSACWAFRLFFFPRELIIQKAKLLLQPAAMGRTGFTGSAGMQHCSLTPPQPVLGLVVPLRGPGSTQQAGCRHTKRHAAHIAAASIPPIPCQGHADITPHIGRCAGQSRADSRRTLCPPRLEGSPKLLPAFFETSTKPQPW